MIALLASALIVTNATPAELVANCRTIIPADVEIDGRIVLRNRKGIVQAEHDYVLVRDAGNTTLKVDGETLTPAPGEAIMGTDVTWSDITLDYLWWDDFSFGSEREGETVHGQVCDIIVMRKAEREVRVWVDRKTGAMMQAEELRDSKSVRRLWGARIKKFGERWMPNVMEVETPGSGHRTKIIVDELKVKEDMK